MIYRQLCFYANFKLDGDLNILYDKSSVGPRAGPATYHMSHNGMVSLRNVFFYALLNHLIVMIFASCQKFGQLFH
jgi:hypothetical protein